MCLFSPAVAASVIKTPPLCKLSSSQHITTCLVFYKIQIVSLPCTKDVTVKQRESNSWDHWKLGHQKQNIQDSKDSQKTWTFWGKWGEERGRLLCATPEDWAGSRGCGGRMELRCNMASWEQREQKITQRSAVRKQVNATFALVATLAIFLAAMGVNGETTWFP